MAQILTIRDLIEEQAHESPRATAIVAPERAPLTYRALMQQIDETARALNLLGVGRNDRVAVVLPNGPEMAVAFLAVACGATCAPLNPAYGAREFDFYLSDSRAKALIVQAAMETPAREVAQAHGIAIIELVPDHRGKAGSFTLAGGDRARATDAGFTRADDVALVLHTSGTTSRPKMVPLTHTNLCTSARNVGSAFKLTGDDRCLNVMPLFHIHGLVAAVLSTVASGGSVVCTPGLDAEEFFEWLDTFEPTWFTAVPTMHQAILERTPSHREATEGHTLRFIRSCSASLAPAVMAELEAVFGVPVLESYGMTEAAHQMTSNPVPPRQRKPGSVGVPTGPDVAILDEAGKLLTTGETGEIAIRGPSVVRGYEKNPHANQQAFTDGWFRTGDQGYLDQDGYLFMTGRIKELINRGGEKVAPREVDEVLMDHPAVVQAVTFGVPHETLGEDVAVAVVLHEQASVSEREMREHAFRHLADYKVPTQVIIVDEIPKGPTGKLQRIGLAEKLGSRLRPEHEAPRSAVGEALARMWAEVLGVDRVGIRDNFFALGGDSLRATRLVSRVRGAFGVELPLKVIFREPVVADQALVVEELLIDSIERLDEEEARQQVGLNGIAT